jgi:hypothetical protein
VSAFVFKVPVTRTKSDALPLNKIIKESGIKLGTGSSENA